MKHLKQLAMKHIPSVTPGDRSISFAGYPGCKPEGMACFVAGGGDHFLQYGITKGSLLLVNFNAQPKAGDLVVVGSVEDPAVHLYTPQAAQADYDAPYPIVTDTDSIIAVILGSFSFFR